MSYSTMLLYYGLQAYLNWESNSPVLFQAAYVIPYLAVQPSIFAAHLQKMVSDLLVARPIVRFASAAEVSIKVAYGRIH